jgi:hypothetical protein
MLEWMQAVDQVTGKDLLLLFGGAFVPVAVQGASLSFRWVRNRAGRKDIKGTWYEYHWTRSKGAPVFREHRVECSIGLLGVKFTVYDHQDHSAKRYFGRHQREGIDYLFSFENRDSSESYTVRVARPFTHRADAEMIGLMMAVDYDGNKYSTVILLSRQPLDQNVAQQAIAEATAQSSPESCLRIRGWAEPSPVIEFPRSQRRTAKRTTANRADRPRGTRRPPPEQRV